MIAIDPEIVALIEEPIPAGVITADANQTTAILAKNSAKSFTCVSRSGLISKILSPKPVRCQLLIH